MSDDNKPFIWAQGQEANVKEPIQALQEHGWRYGDVPTASNFNWLFKMLTEEIVGLKKDLDMQREELNRQAQQQEERLDSKTRELRSDITNSTRGLRTNIANIARSQRSDNNQLAICLEATWDILRGFEQVLRHYHPSLPFTPWPAKVWPRDHRTEAEEEIS